MHRKLSAPYLVQYVLSKRLRVSLFILVEEKKNAELSRVLLCAGQGRAACTAQPAPAVMHSHLGDCKSVYYIV